MQISKTKRILRSIIKRFLYSQLYAMESIKILLGRSKPFIGFTVEEDPPSIYFNFKIKNDRVSDLENMLKLPAGFNLTPIRCLADDKQDYYCLTLNIYRVSGITNGLRAEWDMYVMDPQGRKRYMIVDARSDRGSMDPIEIITRKSKLEYSVKDKKISIYAASYGDTYFKAECSMSKTGSTAFASNEWVEANDDIYWLNGVIDRAFYNGKMACSELHKIPSGDIKIEDTTKWKEYIESISSVVIFPSSIEFLISPWWNL